jgi:hypothetical protein
MARLSRSILLYQNNTRHPVNIPSFVQFAFYYCGVAFFIFYLIELFLTHKRLLKGTFVIRIMIGWQFETVQIF